MIKVQIVSSKNSAPNLFCPKKNYKNESMIINKISFQNPVFIVLYQLLLASIIYVNKNIAKAQPGFPAQVKVNQPCYYTSISMITRRSSKISLIKL